MIVPVLAIVGFILLVAGRGAVSSAGRIILTIVVPSVLFIIVVVGLIIIMVGKGNGSKPDENEGKSYEKKPEINPQEDSGETATAEKEIADNYKQATTKQKILGGIFFGFLILVFGLMLVFVFLQNLVGALVCAGLFAGTIIVVIICAVISQKLMGKRAGSKETDVTLSEEEPEDNINKEE